jgi:hypothetical protein
MDNQPLNGLFSARLNPSSAENGANEFNGIRRQCSQLAFEIFLGLGVLPFIGPVVRVTILVGHLCS